MNKAITTLFVLLLAQQVLTLRINTHLHDAVEYNNTSSNDTDEIPQVLSQLEDAVDKVINDSRKEGEENETLKQVVEKRVEETLEDVRSKLAEEFNKTDENGETEADKLEIEAKKEVDKALEEG